MQKTWVHTELRVRPIRQESAISRALSSVYFPEISDAGWRVFMGLFYTATTAALALATFALVHIATRSHGIRAIENIAEAFVPRALSPRQLFLSLSADEEARLKPTINSIATIIESKTSRVNAYRIAKAIVVASDREHFDPFLAAAIISSESTFNPSASSNRGALGLMQLRPTTGEYIAVRHNKEWEGKAKLTDPVYNIELGISYFRYLEKKFRGNKELALVAYNWGPSNLFSALQKNTSIPSGPKNYAKKILATHSAWTARFAKASSNDSRA